MRRVFRSLGIAARATGGFVGKVLGAARRRLRRAWWRCRRGLRAGRRLLGLKWHAVRRRGAELAHSFRRHPWPWRAALSLVSVASIGALGLWLGPVDSLPRAPSTVTPYSPPPIPPPPPDPDTVFLAWGPSEGDMARALETAQNMSLEEVAGVVILARFSGTNPATAAGLVRDYHVGGVLFFRQNLTSRNQIVTITSAATQAGIDDGRDWPVIIAVDQEGGSVARLRDFIPVMPAFMASGAARDKGTVEEAFAGMGRDVRALGFNVDFAPVIDLTIGLDDPTIRTRSPGSDPENAARTGIAAANGLLDAGVIPTVKHFPGHGGMTVDSHTGAPSTSIPVDELAKTDIYPFQRAIDEGIPVVMIGHIVVEEWGSRPASINSNAYAYLRDEMGFTGVIVTDSLGMGALNWYGDGGRLAVEALNAGADLLITAGNGAPQAHAAIVAAVNNGTLSRERLDEAAARVIALMRYQASLDPSVETQGDYVRTLGRGSATVVTPLCGTPLVGTDVTISGGTSSQRRALAAALESYGVRVGWGGTSILLLRGDDSSGTADIVVSLDGPWGLSRSHATTYIAMYGSDPSTLAALADILVHAVDANARWPVPIPGLPYDPCPSPR